MSNPIEQAAEVVTRAMFGLTTPSMSREIAYHLHAAGLLVTPAHDAAVAAKAWSQGFTAALMQVQYGMGGQRNPYEREGGGDVR